MVKHFFFLVQVAEDLSDFEILDGDDDESEGDSEGDSDGDSEGDSDGQ
jgi:hypothetical protein